MPAEYEFLTPQDKPALLALANPETLARCRAALSEAGYKAHVAGNDEDFASRFAQVQYQVVMIDDDFDPAEGGGSRSLHRLQAMPMSQRRHAATFLFGARFQTLHRMQAFQQSVHAVIHPADLGSLPQILPQVVSDNQLFLNVYRDAQLRMAQSPG